jgi:hypothetical protein
MIVPPRRLSFRNMRSNILLTSAYNTDKRQRTVKSSGYISLPIKIVPDMYLHIFSAAFKLVDGFPIGRKLFEDEFWKH